MPVLSVLRTLFYSFSFTQLSGWHRIFGFFILQAVMVEIVYNRAENFPSNKTLNKDGMTEIINRVLNSYPLFPDSFRQMFYKRYQFSKLKIPSSVEKIQSKLFSYNLNNVQQNFILRWVTGEVDLVSI